MDIAVIAGSVLAVAVLAAVYIAMRRRHRLKQMGELALLPARVLNPRLYSELKTIRAFELDVEQLDKACAWARESDGKRFRTHLAVPLPIAGCGRTCTCQYLPVTENRRRQRRTRALELAELNLDKGGEQNRRGSRGRRKEDQWSGDQR